MGVAAAYMSAMSWGVGGAGPGGGAAPEPLLKQGFVRLQGHGTRDVWLTLSATSLSYYARRPHSAAQGVRVEALHRCTPELIQSSCPVCLRPS
jgi:hypothetical protein